MDTPQQGLPPHEEPTQPRAPGQLPIGQSAGFYSDATHPYPGVDGEKTLPDNRPRGASGPPPSLPPQAMTGKNRRWLWMLLVALLIVVVLAVLSANLFPHQGEISRRNASDPQNGPLSRKVEIGEHALLVIRSHGGDIAIERGSVGVIDVKAHKHGGQGEPEDTQLRYVQDHDPQGNDRLTLTSEPRTKDLDYVIALPQSAQVQLELDSGSCDVSGISGVNLDTLNGSITLEDISGPVQAHTESGDITARNIQGATTLEAGNGSIRLNGIHGQLHATTRSGDVIARGVQLSGQSLLRTRSGSVRVTGALAPDGNYKLETNSGDIDLSLPVNATFQLDASTGSGTVHNGFGKTVVGGTPHARIVITVGSGSINVEGDAPTS